MGSRLRPRDVKGYVVVRNVKLFKDEVKDSFYDLLNSPLRTVLVVTPVESIMYNGGLANRHIAGQVDESELGDRLSSDAQRMNKEREQRGLEPR